MSEEMAGARMKISDAQLLQISERINAEELPGDLPDVAEVTGVYKALLIAARLGCGSVYLCKWPESKGQWTEEIRQWIAIIGEESTEDVVRLFDGNYINIPKCDALFRRFRNEIIRDRCGNTAIELAREFGRSTRQIKRIRNKRDDDRQSPLFEL